MKKKAFDNMVYGLCDFDDMALLNKDGSYTRCYFFLNSCHSCWANCAYLNRIYNGDDYQLLIKVV